MPLSRPDRAALIARCRPLPLAELQAMARDGLVELRRAKAQRAADLSVAVDRLTTLMGLLRDRGHAVIEWGSCFAGLDRHGELWIREIGPAHRRPTRGKPGRCRQPGKGGVTTNPKEDTEMPMDRVEFATLVDDWKARRRKVEARPGGVAVAPSPAPTPPRRKGGRPRTGRPEAMAAAVLAGESTRVVAERFGVTAESVRKACRARRAAS